MRRNTKYAGTPSMSGASSSEIASSNSSAYHPHEHGGVKITQVDCLFVRQHDRYGAFLSSSADTERVAELDYATDSPTLRLHAEQEKSC